MTARLAFEEEAGGAGGAGVRFETEIASIADEWDELARRCDAAPFVYPGWIAAWLEAFGSGDVRIATARERGRLVALMPLLQRRGALVSPSNWHTPLFSLLSVDDRSSRRLLSAILAHGPSRLDLGFVDAEDRLACRYREEAASARYRTLERAIQRSPYVPIEGDWESYEAGVPKRKLSKYRRFRRRLEEQGSVRIEVRADHEGLDGALEDGFAVEAAGWKGRRRTAIRSRPETEAFYRQVARWAADQGWLRLWYVRLDGKAIAFSYSIQTTSADYELKVGFDPEYARFAPGVLLTQARLRNAFDSGLRSFEFLGQADPHKLEWTDSCHTLLRIQAFAPTVSGLRSRLAWERGRPAVRRLRGILRR